jgi:hypothetical protein
MRAGNVVETQKIKTGGNVVCSLPFFGSPRIQQKGITPMQIYSANVIRGLTALTDEDVATCNATYFETLATLRELARRAHDQNAARAQSAFSVGLRHIYQGEAATFAVVARVLERAYAEVEHTLANGVHADVSSDA